MRSRMLSTTCITAGQCKRQRWGKRCSNTQLLKKKKKKNQYSSATTEEVFMALSADLLQYFKVNPLAKFAFDRVLTDAFDDRRSFKFLDEFFTHLGREAWAADEGPLDYVDVMQELNRLLCTDRELAAGEPQDARRHPQANVFIPCSKRVVLQEFLRHLQ